MPPQRPLPSGHEVRGQCPRPAAGQRAPRTRHATRCRGKATRKALEECLVEGRQRCAEGDVLVVNEMARRYLAHKTVQEPYYNLHFVGSNDINDSATYLCGGSRKKGSECFL